MWWVLFHNMHKINQKNLNTYQSYTYRAQAHLWGFNHCCEGDDKGWWWCRSWCVSSSRLSITGGVNYVVCHTNHQLPPTLCPTLILGHKSILFTHKLIVQVAKEKTFEKRNINVIFLVPRKELQTIICILTSKLKKIMLF